MRYYEIVGLNEAILTESMLREGLLDSISKTIGDQVNKKVTVVTNAATALQVIYKVVSNSQYLESMAFEIKRSIKRKLKIMADGTLKQAVSRMFPDGRNLKDFIIGVCLVGVMNSLGKALSWAKDAAQGAAMDQVKDAASGLVKKVLNLDGMISTATGATGLMGIFKALEIGNDVLFELLTAINRKLETVAR